MNKIHILQCMRKVFVWNFKGYFRNSTQNILPIHGNILILYNIEILRALRFKSLQTFLKGPIPTHPPQYIILHIRILICLLRNSQQMIYGELENISICYIVSSINDESRRCNVVRNIQIYRYWRYVYIHELFFQKAVSFKSYLIKNGLNLHLLTVAFQLIIC